MKKIKIVIIHFARTLISNISFNNAIAGKLYEKNIVNIKHLSIRLIDLVYKNEKEKNSQILTDILRYNEKSVEFITLEEREFPGNSENLLSGYYHTMLKRYVFAGKWFCQKKLVLDSCSGLGWGTSILSKYASHITAFDISEESIAFSKENWKSENISWSAGDALNLENFKDNYYDVAVAMETIEHFSKENGELYILNLKEKIKPGGIIIGSSSFPFSRKKADSLCSTNPYHQHVYTYFEFSSFLKKHFKDSKIINNWMFVAKK
jgi:2-polyprenyl-3-methyl-5-hydroxy-6-metoxy-1,4-benzoquinol methylase